MSILQTRIVIERRESDRILHKRSKRRLLRPCAYAAQSESATNSVQQGKGWSRNSCQQLLTFNVQQITPTPTEHISKAY